MADTAKPVSILKTPTYDRDRGRNSVRRPSMQGGNAMKRNSLLMKLGFINDGKDDSSVSEDTIMDRLVRVVSDNPFNSIVDGDDDTVQSEAERRPSYVRVSFAADIEDDSNPIVSAAKEASNGAGNRKQGGPGQQPKGQPQQHQKAARRGSTSTGIMTSFLQSFQTEAETTAATAKPRKKGPKKEGRPKDGAKGKKDDEYIRRASQLSRIAKINPAKGITGKDMQDVIPFIVKSPKLWKEFQTEVMNSNVSDEREVSVLFHKFVAVRKKEIETLIVNTRRRTYSFKATPKGAHPAQEDFKQRPSMLPDQGRDPRESAGFGSDVL